MKNRTSLALLALGSVVAGVGLPSSVQADPVLLPSPLVGSTGARGLVVRTAQGPVDAALANNYNRAIAQINGTLVDAGGALVPNEAVAGPNADGSYTVDVVNFEKDAGPIDVMDVSANVLWTFGGPDFFPGIPGSGGHTDNFAVEVTGFLQLSAGVHTFGIAVGTDRTDVNDDDSFALFTSPNPRDYFGTKVAEFERSAPPFISNTHAETQFQLQAPAAGIYPFRLVQWQASHGSSLHWYSIDEASGDRVLVNDPNDDRAVKSYVSSAAATAKAPYVAEVSPVPGSDGNSSAAHITAVIVDGASAVSTSSVKLFLNGTAVTPQTLTKAGAQVSLAYNPNASRTDKNNLVRLEYADGTGAKYTNSWSFGITVTGGSATTVTGQWDFDSGNLNATIGQALEYLDGTTGLTAQGTQFGTTATFGIDNIGGKVAKVMRVPGDLSNKIGYVVHHGIAPNGGGTRVNQYTLIMDVMVDTSGPGAASLWQTSSLNNTDDGDLFWQGNNFGQGGGGYNGTGAFTPAKWHRIIAAYDEAATPPVVTKFVDGVKQDDWTANQGLDNPRRALQATAVLFGDGDQDERRTMWVNSVQIRSGKLTDAEAAALGAPAADGIPQVIPPTSVTGQWDFDSGNLSASVGKALQFLDGTGGMSEQLTEFGTTTDLGVPDIGGQPARVMKVPGDLSNQIGYIMDHGIRPNGGGTRVNQYTLIMDVLVDTSGPGAASLWQTSSLNNTDDGDLFWQGNNFGQGGGGYNGTGAFTPGVWHRVVAAYDEAATPPVVSKFVDGIKQDDWTANQGLDNPRRALQATAVLFGDGDQDERRTMWVNSVQIRSTKISDAEAVLLGQPTASGIPVVIPQSNVSGQWDFDRKDLAATIGKPLQYLDGTAGITASETVFGITTDLGIPDINGTPAAVMYVPGDLSNQIGYIMDHGIRPNGGGTRVNQYTLIFDILVGTSGPGAASLLQTSSLNNTDDGDLFWQGNNFGQGGGGYNGTGAFTAGEWHRVIAAYDEAANPPVVTKFVDGIKQDDWTANQGLDNPRRALQATAVLFGDGDQDERREMWVNSVQIRSGKLSDAQMIALGGPDASGIPILIDVPVQAAPPSLALARTGSNLTISWDAAATGFTLESSSVVSGGSWTAVSGVAGNSVTVSTASGAKFYRLRK